MIDIIRNHGEFAHSGDLERTVEVWEDQGFTPEQVNSWLDARCFSPSSAKELRDAGITPEEAATVVDEQIGLGSYRDTIGYKVSNSHLSVENARAVLSGN